MFGATTQVEALYDIHADSFTFDLRTCKQVTYNQLVDIDFDLLAEKLLQYVFMPNEDNDDFIGSYRFDKIFCKRNICRDFTLCAIYKPEFIVGILFINDPLKLNQQRSYEWCRTGILQCTIQYLVN